MQLFAAIHQDDFAVMFHRCPWNWRSTHDRQGSKADMGSRADDGDIELVRYRAEQYLANKIVSQNYKMWSATLTVSGINHPAKPFVL